MKSKSPEVRGFFYGCLMRLGMVSHVARCLIQLIGDGLEYGMNAGGADLVALCRSKQLTQGAYALTGQINLFLNLLLRFSWHR